MLIYQIVHIESGFKYIGQTTRPAIKRWREHLYSLRNGRHRNIYLQNAWNKYGEQAFKFEVIKEVNTLDELNQAEKVLIEKGSDLYNLSPGGNSFKHDIKAKKAIGESNKIPIIGMSVKTGEIKEYGSAADTKINGFNEKCVRKCVLGFVSHRKDGTTFKSISHKGWVWMAKECFDLQNLQNLREVAKRAKIRFERPVIGMHVFTKEIKSFISASEAGRNGFNMTAVYRSCNVFSAIHKGFVWVYADINDPQSLLREKSMSVISKVRTGPKSW